MRKPLLALHCPTLPSVATSSVLSDCKLLCMTQIVIKGLLLLILVVVPKASPLLRARKQEIS